MAKLGNELKKIRLKKGLSQERLARLLDVTTRTVQRWEKGLESSELKTVKIKEFIKKNK